MFEPLIPARAVAAHDSVPFSPEYGDVYHAAAGAFAQAEHVFLRGNGLPGRWRERPLFTVLETGFGLGLNFLALWHAWRVDPARSERLHVVSIEAHPFAAEDLARWLRALVPAPLRDLAEQLLAAWPPLLPGLHVLDFAEGRVRLILGFGRAERVVPELELAADAYFLDGFAPARNPQMWSDELIAALALHAAPGATAATWASAGSVRRALAAAGFTVRKQPGFAGKREMTVARHAEGGAGGRAVCARRRAPARALVVGDGVAGAGVAHALANAGWQVQVIAPPEAGAGGHLAAALTPAVDALDSVRARLSRAGAGLAANAWREVIATDAAMPAHALAWRAGTVQVAPRRQARNPEALAAWRAGLAGLGLPEDWLRLVDAHEAGALAGVPVGRAGAFLAGGLLVRPARLRDWLLGRSGVRRTPGEVGKLARSASGWRALGADGQVLAEAEVVVLATAAATPGLLRASGLHWPLGEAMQAVAGQITRLPADADAPRRIVAGDGYVLPPVEGAVVLGSTYDHATPWGAPAPVTPAGHAANLAHRAALLPAAAPAAPAACTGWAGWRAVLPGRLPAIGALPGVGGLFVACAYASRGLAYSALGGAAIAARLAGAPAPLERELAAAADPVRVAA